MLSKMRYIVPLMVVLVIVSSALSQSQLFYTTKYIEHMPSVILQKNTNTILFSSSFFGGDGNDGDFYTGNNMVIDAEGNVIISGTTDSSNFPITNDVYSTEQVRNTDLFVAKFSGDLSHLICSTIIGGTNNEEAKNVFVDKDNNIVISGITESADFPVTESAYQQRYRGGTTGPYSSGDAFILKISNDFSTLLSSTFLGGSGHEYCSSLNVDKFGNVYVSGSTSSGNFPTTEGAYDRTYTPQGYFGEDIFVSKLSGDLSQLIGSTYVGGSGDDYTEQLGISSSGNIVIGGWTSSANYPTTPTAFDSTFSSGYYDAFVSVLNADLTELVASTYIGGTGWDFCYGLTIDSDDNIYITGHTASRNYPVTDNVIYGSYQGIGGAGVGDDVFVTKLSSNLQVLMSSTYFGGSAWDCGFSIIVTDSIGDIFITGTTSSINLPVTDGAFDETYNGGETHYGDAFICRLTNDMTNITASSFFGGNENEVVGQLAATQDGVYLVGSTGSEELPISNTSYDSEFNGGISDTFICFLHSSLSVSTPFVPQRPQGILTGTTGEEYEYIGLTTDPNNDDLYYLFDWGDNTTSGWLGPYVSGEECTVKHSWSEDGNYSIRVKAKDTQGLTSQWSDPLVVSMPYIHMPVRDFLEKLFNWLIGKFISL